MIHVARPDFWPISEAANDATLPIKQERFHVFMRCWMQRVWKHLAISHASIGGLCAGSSEDKSFRFALVADIKGRALLSETSVQTIL